MAIGLGIKAAMAGYRVIFTIIPLLINHLKEARGQSILRSFELRFEKNDLVIADELDIFPLTSRGMNFYLHICRYGLEENQLSLPLIYLLKGGMKYFLIRL